MRRIRGAEVRRAREALAMRRADLAECAGIFPGHLGKIERGEIERVKRRRRNALAKHLGLKPEQLGEAPELSDAEAWAERNGTSRSYALELAADGRLEGAYQDEKGAWHIDTNARIMAPTERSRARWRERYDKYDRDRQRRRRARARAKGTNPTSEMDQDTAKAI